MDKVELKKKVNAYLLRQEIICLILANLCWASGLWIYGWGTMSDFGSLTTPSSAPVIPYALRMLSWVSTGFAVVYFIFYVLGYVPRKLKLPNK